MAPTVWQINDGTTVTLEERRPVVVEGRTDYAKALRWDLGRVRQGESPLVGVVPPPGGGVALDASNRYLVDLWLRDLARRHGLRVQTAYVRNDEDAPADARDLLRRRAAEPFDEDVIY